MANLKLGPPEDDKPVKLAMELPASPHRDLIAYADYLNSRHVSVSQAGGEPCRI
jgi:hypothetical protein